MSNIRAYAEIDLNAIKNNTKQVRNIIGNDVKIMAVVKADGYGHGAIMTAKAINETVDAFAVATIEEAIEIRERGIEKDILILGYLSPDNYGLALKHSISLTVFSYETAKVISDFAINNGGKIKIHIAVDTGMGRIGFYPCDENVETVQKISKLCGVEIDGVFSHFATADEEDKDYSVSQVKKFNEFLKKLESAGVELKNRHICNSAGIIDLPDCHFDMVRMGIILYGYYPSKEVKKERFKLSPSMSIKSTVIHVKTIYDLK